MQCRLFFRFHVESKVIALGWVNDEDTKRAYGAKDDAYRVFSKMLAPGHPPNDWNALIKKCLSFGSNDGAEDSPHRNGELAIEVRAVGLGTGSARRRSQKVGGGSVWRIGSERRSWSRNTVQPDLRELAQALAYEICEIC
jgi:hypothetical protein